MKAVTIALKDAFILSPQALDNARRFHEKQ